MSIVFDLSPDGDLPPGRFPATWDEVYDCYVAHDLFATSMSRPQIWAGLDALMLKIFTLEAKYEDILDGPLVHALWLGGSFIGPKVNPGDVDATLWLHHDAATRLAKRPGVGLLKKNRDHFLDEHQVDLVIAYHRPVPSLFNLKRNTDDERAYFIDRGRWDDWWQRDRVDGVDAPSVASSYPRRGYLEVNFDA